MSLSACLIVKNESKHLEKCLSCLKDNVDEIIVVDTGSSDSTKEIAAKFTSKIFDFAWKDDFSEARSFSISKASSDWIFVIDADEIISNNDIENIKEIISKNEYDAIAVKQLNYTNRADEFNFVFSPANNFQGYIPCNIIRIFRNNKKIKFSNPVHESVDSSIKSNNFKVFKSDIPIHHFQDEKGYENLKEKQLKYMEMCEKNLDKMENKAKAHRDIAIVASNFQKDYAKAIAHFNESLKHNPNNLKTYIGLGWACINSKNYADAEKTFLAALKLYPRNPALYASLGRVFEQQNYLEKALHCYQKAMDLGYQETAKLFILTENIKKKLNNPYSFKVNYK